MASDGPFPSLPASHWHNGLWQTSRWAWRNINVCHPTIRLLAYKARQSKDDDSKYRHRIRDYCRYWTIWIIQPSDPLCCSGRKWTSLLPQRQTRSRTWLTHHFFLCSWTKSSQLTELKLPSAGATWYHSGDKTVEIRACQLSKIYRHKVKNIDRKYCGTSQCQIDPIQ